MTEEPAALSSFEGSFEELEELVRRLEGGALTLDESLACYEKGVSALRRCYRILDVAEKRLELLVKDGDGGAATKAIDLTELRGEARGAAKVGPVEAPAQIAAATPQPDLEAKVAAPAKTPRATSIQAAAPAPKASKQAAAEKPPPAPSLFGDA